MKKKTTSLKKKRTVSRETFFLLYTVKKSLFLFGSVAGIFLLVVMGSVGMIVHFSSHSFTIPCANTKTCLGDLSGKVSPNTQGTYMGKAVASPDNKYFAGMTGITSVLGAATGAKHIYVDLSAQRLYAYQGSTLLFNDSVATGKWNLTPTGTFEVWVKLQATLMAGGEGATSYYLPNVPWTMYFYNAKIPKSDGYSLHGKYWDTVYGTPDSHGCVNMRISDAKSLYDWIDPPTTSYTTYSSAGNPGTLVTIYGTTPKAGLVGTQFYNNNTSFNAGTVL